MDSKFESFENFLTTSHLEHKLSDLKLYKSTNNYDNKHKNDLFGGNFDSESDSDSSTLSNIFTNGVNDSNYSKFCVLFSKALNKPSRKTSLNSENHDHTTDLSRESDFNNIYFEDFDDNLGDVELETVYWECLEWLVNIFDELNRFESLGFGISFLIKNLKRFTDDYSLSKDTITIENVEKVKKLIDFINVFRDANSSIYTTYALLDRMETKLNQVRYKSIKILQLKLNNKSKFISSNVGVTSPMNNPFDQFDNTPINTPSSTTTSMSDRGEMDLLYEIWDNKLCKLRLLVFKKFRYYLISVVNQLKNMYLNFNYYKLIQFIVYTQLPSNNNVNLYKVNNINNNIVFKNNNDDEEDDSRTSKENYSDNGTKNNDNKIDNEEKENTELLYNENEDILEYLNKYYSVRNMNEEEANSYVSRIRDLNNRLIPKFVKIITKLPIYYEAFLNTLICNNIQDGMFQLISSNGNLNYKDLNKEFFRESYNYLNKENKDNYKDNNKENIGLRDGMETYREYREEYKSWLQKIDVVKMLNKTNLEVVDAVRCSFNNSRKLVIFSQGSLKDLFNNYSNYNYKDLYKDTYQEHYKDNKCNTTNNKEYYKDNNYNKSNFKEFKDYRDNCRDAYKDNIIIKSESKDGPFSKMDKDDDEILKRIYYCNNNLSEVANGEIEKVIIQHMPAFSWSPKLVKHQLSLQTHQSNYDYNMNQDLDHNNIDNLAVLETSGFEYIEYIKLEEKIWMNRLNMFNKINERNIRNFLMKRNNNSVNKIKYESSNLLINNKIPFIVLLDYNNYIPIKYIYNQNNDKNNNTYNNNTNQDYNNKHDSDDRDWLIRLFNNNNNNIVFKNNCIDIEIERDLFPGFYLFNNFKLNCFILPIHENNFQSQETFVNFSKMLQNRIDLMYPSYLQQINHFIFSSNYNNINVNKEYSNNKSVIECNENKDKYGVKYGDYFVTYHTNLSIGNKDKNVINFVFHLVCCDTSMNDDISPIEYADDTEVILNHVKKIQPVLNGLGKILKVCNELKIQTIHLPASLKCCYKINQHNNSIIQSDFHQHSYSNYSHFHSQMTGNYNNNKEYNNKSVIECNNDYVRCLAVVSHLASLLNKNKYCIKNVNLIFPQHLNQTLLPKTAVNIFTNRVNTF